MFPLGVVGGLQEITSVELSGECVCKSLTGPDTAVKCKIIIQDSYNDFPGIIFPKSQTPSPLLDNSHVSSVIKSLTILPTLPNLFLDWTWK